MICKELNVRRYYELVSVNEKLEYVVVLKRRALTCLINEARSYYDNRDRNYNERDDKIIFKPENDVVLTTEQDVKNTSYHLNGVT